MQVNVIAENKWMQFVDIGTTRSGLTHKYEVRARGDYEDFDVVLGWVEWKSGWRRYTFRPTLGASTWFDFECLTSIADFVKLRTDERKSQWGPQGRFADRQ